MKHNTDALGESRYPTCSANGGVDMCSTKAAGGDIQHSIPRGVLIRTRTRVMVLIYPRGERQEVRRLLGITQTKNTNAVVEARTYGEVPNAKVTSTTTKVMRHHPECVLYFHARSPFKYSTVIK